MVTLATQDMAERISALVHRSFTELCAQDWEPGATRGFLEETSPAALSVALQLPTFAAVESEGDAPIGFLLIPRPSLLSLLFVHPGHLRKGVAGRLWEAARGHIEAVHPETKTVELNSTPYAFGAYRALGFVPISTEFVRRGCRVTRMACWLPARALVPMRSNPSVRNIHRTFTYALRPSQPHHSCRRCCRLCRLRERLQQEAFRVGYLQGELTHSSRLHPPEGGRSDGSQWRDQQQLSAASQVPTRDDRDHLRRRAPREFAST